MDRKMKEAMFSLNDELEMFPETIMITVQRSHLEALVKGLFHSAGEWDNHSALGYAISAAKSIGLRSEDIQALVITMRHEFDEKTLDAAAEIYRESSY